MTSYYSCEPLPPKKESKKSKKNKKNQQPVVEESSGGVELPTPLIPMKFRQDNFKPSEFIFLEKEVEVLLSLMNHYGTTSINSTGRFDVFLALRMHQILQVHLVPFFTVKHATKANPHLKNPRSRNDIDEKNMPKVLPTMGYVMPNTNFCEPFWNEPSTCLQYAFECIAHGHQDLAMILLSSPMIMGNKECWSACFPPRGMNTENFADLLEYQDLSQPVQVEKRKTLKQQFFRDLWFRGVQGCCKEIALLGKVNGGISSVDEIHQDPAENYWMSDTVLGKLVNPIPRQKRELDNIGAMNKRYKMAKWLIKERGADIYGKSRYGRNAFLVVVDDLQSCDVPELETLKLDDSEESEEKGERPVEKNRSSPPSPTPLRELFDVMMKKGGDINRESHRGITAFSSVLNCYDMAGLEKARKRIHWLMKNLGGDPNHWKKPIPDLEYKRKRAKELGDAWNEEIEFPGPKDRCVLVDVVDQACMREEGAPFLERMIEEFGCDPHWVEEDTPGEEGGFKQRLQELNFGRNLGFWGGLNHGAAAIPILHKFKVDLEHIVPYDGFTGLFLAAFKNFDSCVKAYLDHGVPVKYGCSETRADEYMSKRKIPVLQPIIGAAWNGNPEILRLLLDKGSNVNAACGNQQNLFRNCMTVGDDCHLCGENWANLTPECRLLDEGATVACIVSGGFCDTYVWSEQLVTKKIQDTLECLEILQEFNADFKALDNKGRGVMDYAKMIIPRRRKIDDCWKKKEDVVRGGLSVINWLEKHLGLPLTETIDYGDSSDDDAEEEEESDEDTIEEEPQQVQ